jgi:hypothetical protein
MSLESETKGGTVVGRMPVNPSIVKELASRDARMCFGCGEIFIVRGGIENLHRTCPACGAACGRWITHNKNYFKDTHH